MKIAIVNEDKSGPAYGVGKTEIEARKDAAKWGFTGGVAVEITEECYARILAGNPDAARDIPTDL